MPSQDYYRSRIQKALVYIESHLTDRISALDLAQAAYFSPYHFHRLFSAYTGEPVHKYVLSRRMEQGARRLREEPDTRLTELALSVGFETHSAFSRAFRNHFGESPTTFRKHRQTPGPDRSRPYLLTVPTPSVDLVADIRVAESLSVHYRITTSTVNGHFFAHHKPLQALQSLWDDCGASLLGLVSCFPASPRALNDDSAEAWYGGLSPPGIPIDWAQFEHKLEAGDWAVFLHRGDYRYLHQTWCQIYRGWLPLSVWALRHDLPFEKYLTDPRHTNPRFNHGNLATCGKSAGSEQQRRLKAG